jgi:hypothetical protein
MMNVPPTRLDNKMKWRNVVLDGINHGANSGEGKKETDGSNKKPPPRPVRNAFMENGAERCALQQQQQKSRSRDGEQEYEPGIGHATLEHAECEQLRLFALRALRRGPTFDPERTWLSHNPPARFGPACVQLQAGKVLP